MNYIHYMQAGGAVQADPQAQLEALVERAMSGDNNAIKALQQIMQSNPQLKTVIEQMVAAKQGAAQEVPAEQAGGKVPVNTKERIPDVKLNTSYVADPNYRVSEYYVEGVNYPQGSNSYVVFGNDKDGYVGRSISYGQIPAQNDTTYIVEPTGRGYGYVQPSAKKQFNEYQKEYQDKVGSRLYPYMIGGEEMRIQDSPIGYDKCGGKIKKGEKGLPIPAKKVMKNAKGGCPCQLKKVGGKLVEVDSCTGQIVK